jgi:glycosyltransferase involved in cell wall biosynthesis
MVPKPTRFRNALPLQNIRGLNPHLINGGNIKLPRPSENAGASERAIEPADKHGTTARTLLVASSPARSRASMVSCLMVTASRPAQARISVECYRQQNWPNRKLTIVDTGTDDALERWLKEIDDRSVNYKRIERGKMTAGDILNAAIQRARGDYLCIWSDDHLHHPLRIETQMKAMASSRTDACMLSRLLIWWPYAASLVVSGRRLWEPTLIIKREAMPPHASLSDADFIPTLKSKARITSLDAPELYIYVEHMDSGWSGDRFENVRRAATINFSADEQDGVLARLCGVFPIDDYMDAIRI